MSTIYDECSKDELLQIAYEMQNVLNDSKKENKELQRDINDLQSELAGATNDYKQATNEIKLLNNQIDNLQRNIGYLCEENRKLRDTINAHEQFYLRW